MIKYIGSKRKLMSELMQVMAALPNVANVLDLFSGTARVSSALRGRGYTVTANDHNRYAYTLANCYVAGDHSQHAAEAQGLLAQLNGLPGQPGYFTQTFCEEARFFQPKNGARIDAIREAIATWEVSPELEAILLVSLMEAADRVDSTVGLQMAYLKHWAPRSFNDLELRMPELTRGPVGRALMLDALACARTGSFDVVYLDPPYNQHKYLNNYHVWESLVRWDKPEVYGVARKRVDCRDYDSPFNSRRRIHTALRDLVDTLDTRFLVMSFNDEGYVTEEDMRAILATRGSVAVLRVDSPRYVGAKIGIYNPAGVKTGKVSHLHNQELIFVVACGQELPEAIRERAECTAEARSQSPLPEPEPEPALQS
ncbi:MAG TPA: DNA adenine methylase [Polyangiales bacterium]|nr:DNA adenine methylase [Polyangiales bacterium]